jgi:hypothetical protein
VRFEAALQQRQLRLSYAGQPLLALPLDQGGRWRLVLPDEDGVDAAVAALESAPGVAVLPAQGGLLGSVSVAANLSLALRYGQDADAATLRGWAHKLELVLSLFGVSQTRQRSLGQVLPMQLGLMERWQLGLALRVMRPPEVLVLDRAFAGLSRRQAESALAMLEVYHTFHPFRPILCVDLDAHGLPVLPQCRATAGLNAPAALEPACPS